MSIELGRALTGPRSVQYFQNRESNMTNYDEREIQAPQARELLLFRRLQEILPFAVHHSSGWASRLSGVDFRSIATRNDLSKLPILRKSQLIVEQDSRPPFAGLVARRSGSFPRLFLSPGPICEPQLPTSDSWNAARALHAAGLCKDDILLNTFSYHLTPGGFMFDSGARTLGCAVIPAGPGNTEQLKHVLDRYRPSAFAGTADFLNALLVAFERAGGSSFPIQQAVLPGAAVPQNLRDRFNAVGIAVHELYGTAELGVVAYETDAHQGFIANEDLIIEILDSITGNPVSEGATGEVVVTRLSSDYPLFRFATGDLSAVLPGTSPCGRTNTRLKGWLGRADQTAKVKGMFVHPTQVIEVINRTPEVTKGQLVISRHDDRDEMTLEVETGDGRVDAPALSQTLTDITKLRGTVRVVPNGSIAQSGAIIDRRTT